MKNIFRNASLPAVDSEALPFIQLWTYRIFTQLGGAKEFVSNHGFDNDAIAEIIGMSHHLPDDGTVLEKMLLDEQDVEFKPAAIRREIIARAKIAEKNPPSSRLPKSLMHNVKSIAELVGLNEIEQYLLGFSTLLATDDTLETVANYIGRINTSKTYHVVSVILNLPENDIKKALNSNGTLSKSGLLSVCKGSYHLDAKLEMFSDKFADAILTGESDPIQLFKETIKKSSEPLLTLKDYPHIKKNLDILKPLLKEAITHNIPGINIYIHGPSGTGKTQLAKVLAQYLKTELFEIACEDEDGDPIRGDRRLRSYSAAQTFLKNRSAILLFDEVEDIYNDGGFTSQSTAQSKKAWMNRALEENTIPTLWLSNTRHGVDPAFVRRYSMVFEMNVPPESQRIKILKQYTKGSVSPRIIKQLAKSEDLAPAVIANATNITQIVSRKNKNISVDETLPMLINQTLEAQDYKAVKVKQKPKIEQPYNPNIINASINVDTLITGLKKHRSGRLCFYGVPGTGKTALGKHIAKQLDMPLICKKASDLLSMWVGGTEANIAAAFKQATEEKALLLIDEVDSFLQNRAGAQRSWETTQVNEMLTQMENFEGIFIASTNLVDTLDPASIRRFDAKVKFNYLTQTQLSTLCQSFCKTFSIKLPAQGINTHLQHLHAITPGDFALIGNQLNFSPIQNFADLISRLEDEQEIKGENKKSIGFV